jgi:hypothetical protein
MEKIVNCIDTNIINIYFNWDEPFNWDSCELYNKAKLLDAVFICCEETLPKYIEHGTKESYYCLPGYDKNIHTPLFFDDSNEENYKCDISICCTNLYEDPILHKDQYVQRKELIDTIYNNQNKYGYTFFIYGGESLKNLYPQSYKGFVSYNNTNYVFNYSKINICTHVQCNKNMYLNERCILIAGSGGLLFIDPVKGIDNIFQNNINCVHIDKDNYINQIVNILNNYDKYYTIRHNIHKTSKDFTWDKWAEIINKYLIDSK